MHNTPASSSGLLKELQEDISAALLPGRACHPLGLQGIAITHSTVTQTDVKYICDLLEPVTIIRKSSNTPRGHNDKDKDKDDSSNNSKDTNNSKNAAGRPRGLRYLDLGFNRMGCTNCSEVLRAAARGNLECLDLAGNFSHRGGPFLAAIVETLTANSPVNNNLSGRGDNDDYSSDGGSDDGNNNNSNSNYSNSNSNSNGGSSSSGNSKATMKSLSGASRTPRNTNSSPYDTLSLHLPKHIPLQYTCHLKHLVSPPTLHCAVLHHTTSQPSTKPHTILEHHRTSLQHVSVFQYLLISSLSSIIFLSLLLTPHSPHTHHTHTMYFLHATHTHYVPSSNQTHSSYTSLPPPPSP